MKFHWFLLFLLILAVGCAPFSKPETSPSPTLFKPSPVPLETPLPPPDPRTLVQVYMDAWKAEDYTTMYAWLAPLSQDTISEEDFVSLHRDLAATMSLETLAYEVLSILVGDRTAQAGYRVLYHTRLVGEVQRENVMNLKLEKDQWRVLWDQGLILPELSGGNLLWMEYRLPSRGNIYDREGRALVAQNDAVSLGIIVGETDPVQEPALLAELNSLTGVDLATIRAQMETYRDGWYLPVGEATAQSVESRYGVLTEFKGLVLGNYQTRYYFEGGIAPHLIGYVSQIQPEEVEQYRKLGYQQDERVGRMGLEKWGEAYMVGHHGGVLYVVTPEGEIVTKLAESISQPAQTVVTTLDRDLQLSAQDALEGFRGAVVVLERDSGRVLAMASSPSFDPNLFETTTADSNNQLETLLTDGATPLLNRATQGQYPLGSVFKIITMAAALESGLYSGDSTYYCGQKFTELSGTVRYDWTYSHNVAASGLLTLPEGLMRSCNPYFWHIGLDLYDEGLDRAVSDMGLAFGLGQATGIEQIVEALGDIPVPESQVDAVNFAIGQGATLVTPIQVARIVAAVGNGGELLRPQVVERVEPPGGDAVYSFKPEVMDELSVSPETLSLLQDAMRSVVENPKGTAYWRFINFPIPLAGKTGTAETPGDPHAWFAGYTFAEDPDNPDLAIAVILEHAGEGSQVAAPIFRRLVEVYFLGQPLIPLPWETELPSPPSG